MRGRSIGHAGGIFQTDDLRRRNPRQRGGQDAAAPRGTGASCYQSLVHPPAESEAAATVVGGNSRGSSCCPASLTRPLEDRAARPPRQLEMPAHPHMPILPVKRTVEEPLVCLTDTILAMIE